MSETNSNPAEPTEPEPGGTAVPPPPPEFMTVDDPEEDAEPTEPEPGGTQ